MFESSTLKTDFQENAARADVVIFSESSDKLVQATSSPTPAAIFGVEIFSRGGGGGVASVGFVGDEPAALAFAPPVAPTVAPTVTPTVAPAVAPPVFASFVPVFVSFVPGLVVVSETTTSSLGNVSPPGLSGSAAAFTADTR